LAKVDKGDYNVCRKFNVRETAYLIQNCRLFFSADTAPLHIATAMGVDAACFFGPNTPVLYGPRGKNDVVFYRNINCSPCLTNFNAKTSNCRKPVCITEITVDDVWKKIVKYFENPEYAKLADYAQDI
jgi:ADP-heptose:LPS heptosyltransferase